jgi:NPCBM/NEW2 domain-containing protein
VLARAFRDDAHPALSLSALSAVVPSVSRTKVWIFALCLVSGLCARAGTVLTLSGERVEGKVLIEFGGKITVVPLGRGEPRKFDLASVVVVNFREAAAAADRDTRGLTLRNGERAVDVLDPQPDGSIKLKRRNVIVPAVAISRAGLFAEPVEPVKPGKTGVILRNGDFFEGEIRGFASGGVKVNSLIFGQRVFPLGEIFFAVFRPIEPAVTQYELNTRDGSRFFPESFSFDRDAISFKDQMLGDVKVRFDEIAEFRLGSARVRPLVEMKPQRVDVVKGLDPAAAMSVDKALTGEPLVVGRRQPVEHGIETALGSAVTYAVPAGFGAFACQVAVPERVAPPAKLTFSVFADGRLIVRTQPHGASEAPEAVRANFGSAQLLTLRVEAAGAGATQGSGIWMQPTFLAR